MAPAKCVVPGGLSPLGVGPSGTHQWEVVDGSLDSLDKALQAVSSHLPDKVAWTTTGTMGGFPDCPEGCAEMLGRTRAIYIGIRARTSWP